MDWLERIRSLVADATADTLGHLADATPGALDDAEAEVVAAADRLYDGEDPSTLDADDVQRLEALASAAERIRVAREHRRPRTSLADLSDRQDDRTRPNGDAADAEAAATLTAVTASGQTLDDGHDLAERFAESMRSLGQRRATVGRRTFASLTLDYPDDRTLGGDPHVNDQLLADVVEPDAIVAAGGLCNPVDASYDVAGIESADRPIRDALPQFGADRGGIRFTPPPTLSDVEPGVTVWTEANDQDPSDPATKPVATIDCPAAEEVVVDAVPGRARIGEFQRRFHPEYWQRILSLLLAQQARVAENRLFDTMVAASIAATQAEQLGAARDLLAGIDTAVAAYRFRHRTADGLTLRWVAPTYVRDMIRADLARQLPGDETMRVTDAQVDDWLAQRGVSPVWAIDAGSNNTFDAQASGGALAGFPSTVQTLLYAEGTHVFLDGGRLDLGAEVRDTDALDTNDVETFAETFEQVATVGVESVAVTFDVCASGESQGTVAAAICGS